MNLLQAAIKLIIIIVIFLLTLGKFTLNLSAQSNPPISENKIQVLNFGTFHMGETSDENKVSFDENDKENQRKVHEIAAMIAVFKPTVILVETPPSYDEKLHCPPINWTIFKWSKFAKANLHYL